MQLSLFRETIEPDVEALAACLNANIVAIDLETETKWSGLGPKVDFGLSYPADVTVIALAWSDASSIRTTALSAPFTGQALTFLKTLITKQTTFVAHNAVFDFRQ